LETAVNSNFQNDYGVDSCCNEKFLLSERKLGIEIQASSCNHLHHKTLLQTQKHYEIASKEIFEVI